MQLKKAMILAVNNGNNTQEDNGRNVAIEENKYKANNSSKSMTNKA